jgi:hypothetical protein
VYDSLRPPRPADPPERDNAGPGFQKRGSPQNDASARTSNKDSDVGGLVIDDLARVQQGAEPSDTRRVSFDVTVRSTANTAITVTRAHLRFERYAGGCGDDSVLPVSNVYGVRVGRLGAGVCSKVGDFEARFWQPNQDGRELIVLFPVSQQVLPREGDRFRIALDFEQGATEKLPDRLDEVVVTLTYNGDREVSRTLHLK